MQACKVALTGATEITRRYFKPIQGQIIGLIYWQMLMEACGVPKLQRTPVQTQQQSTFSNVCDARFSDENAQQGEGSTRRSGQFKVIRSLLTNCASKNCDQESSKNVCLQSSFSCSQWWLFTNWKQNRASRATYSPLTQEKITELGEILVSLLKIASL